MISYGLQQTMFGDYSQNKNAANLARGAQLANIEHRYLLQKFFSNEGSFQVTTVGTQNLTLTGGLSAGATSATLSSTWPYANNITQVTFSDGETFFVQFTNGSTAITWVGGLVNNVTSAIKVAGLQLYNFPANYSKIKTATITIGALKWTPTEILTRQDWDKLNVFPYYADIPNNFFIYPGGDHGAQIGIWPIPSTTGNVLTFNYKFRIPDLSIVDATGSASVAKGSTTVTATGLVPTVNPQLEARWIQFAQPDGDNLWYQIANITSTTNINLLAPYQGNSITSKSYTIGQMPLLMEDFQDMLVWKPLMTYFSTIVKDTEKFEQFKFLYEDKHKQLEEYAGTKTVNVNLSHRPPNRNPNLFGQTFG